MATAGGTRDARRRRIVDRGSDRLALITGKIQTLPSPASSSPPDSSPPSLAAPDHLSSEDKLSETLFQKLESSFDAPQSSSTAEDASEIPADRDQMGSETGGLPNVELRPKSEITLSPSRSQSASPHTSGNVHPSNNLPANLLKLINPGQISSAIATSTDTRLLCSVIGALVVVLSSIGFPLLGSWIIRGVLTFRPLYLVLVTNVTIVIARFMSYKQSGHERAAREENRAPSNEENGWADHVGTSLELGFLMMKILDAVVMDCSVYAIVLVCGLSFFQKFI